MSGLLVDRFLFRGFQPKRITTISACAKTYDMSQTKCDKEIFGRSFDVIPSTSKNRFIKKVRFDFTRDAFP